MEAGLVKFASQFGITHKLLTCAKLMYPGVKSIAIVSGDIYDMIQKEDVTVSSVDHLKR